MSHSKKLSSATVATAYSASMKKSGIENNQAEENRALREEAQILRCKLLFK